MVADIVALENTARDRAQLCDLLIDTVASGGSVSFMHPLSPEDAAAFWAASLSSAKRGERMVLGVRDGDVLVATVTLLLHFPPNQPHRAEIAKMMTRTSHRGRGIARALMQRAEALAVAAGKSHLVLDTATEEGASGFYKRLGFNFVGEIPNFALKPHGGLTGTLIFWKELGRHADQIGR